MPRAASTHIVPKGQGRCGACRHCFRSLPMRRRRSFLPLLLPQLPIHSHGPGPGPDPDPDRQRQRHCDQLPSHPFPAPLPLPPTLPPPAWLRRLRRPPPLSVRASSRDPRCIRSLPRRAARRCCRGPCFCWFGCHMLCREGYLRLETETERKRKREREMEFQFEAEGVRFRTTLTPHQPRPNSLRSLRPAPRARMLADGKPLLPSSALL